MWIAFIIWSIVSLIFLGIAISTLRAKEPVGFFTFVKAPQPEEIKDVKKYNRSVGILWLFFASALELSGCPFLFLESNSPYFVFIALIVMVMSITLAIAYSFIFQRYKK